MKSNESTRRQIDPTLDALLAGFGFDDPWDSWMDRVRELEATRPLGSIGPYQILGEVGRGGQGVVYKARFSATGEVFALKRLVAGSLAGPESRARLERELEATSILDHPSIVRVFGIDTIDDQPVLAMEWIDGRAINARAGSAGADQAGVLRMFREVCAAVHHAHQRGVLHRDLKPSNILVDATGRPRLLDFGLAKIATANLEHLTRSDIFLGTPAYASPEQIRSSGRFADVRSDVYSLGVVLFELLTGRLPFDPPRPDAFLVAQAPIGSLRPRDVRPELDRDLEAIVLRAMEPDPNRRYQSAGDLEDDLGRFLSGEPVAARRPARLDTAKRFLLRHRAATTITAATLTLLVGWAVVAGLFAARLAARSRETDAARRTADSINTFLLDVLATPRPARAGAEASVISVMELASKRVDSESSLDPLARAGVHVALGRTFQGRARPCEAEAEFRAAAALYRERGNAARDDLARALMDLASALSDMKQPEAVVPASEALALLEEKYGPGSAKAAEAQMALASAAWKCNVQALDAESLMRRALAVLDAATPANNASLAVFHSMLGECLLAHGRPSEARPEFERSLPTLRTFATSDSEFAQALASSLDLYSNDLLSLGALSEAAIVMQERWPLEQRLFGRSRESFWYWRLATIESRLGDPHHALLHANAGLASSWHTPDVPTDEGDDPPDDSAYFAGAPLAGDPASYAQRVDDALRRQGVFRWLRPAQLRWLAGVCQADSHDSLAAALRARADQTESVR